MAGKDQHHSTLEGEGNLPFGLLPMQECPVARMRLAAVLAGACLSRVPSGDETVMV